MKIDGGAGDFVWGKDSESWKWQERMNHQGSEPLRAEAYRVAHSILNVG
jgi:hypothetical protein